jgi:hypothetical protein
MQCAKCGTTLDHSGQGHTCGPAGIAPTDPPSGWVVAAAFLIGLSALFAVTSVIYAVLRLNVPSGTLDQLGALAFSVAIIGLITASIFWRHSTRKLVDAYGGAGRRYAAHWGYRVYSVALFAVIFVQFQAGFDSRTAIVAVAVLRCLAALALIGGVLHTWVRIRRLMAGLPKTALPDRVDQLMEDAKHVDWNTASWDPDLQEAIDRRRRLQDDSRA